MAATRPSTSTVPGSTWSTRMDALADVVVDDAAAVGVRQDHVVVVGQEAHRRRCVGVGTGGVGQVEQLVGRPRCGTAAPGRPGRSVTSLSRVRPDHACTSITDATNAAR